MAHTEDSLIGNRSAGAAHEPHLSILYVEDNAIVREVTAELLAQDGRRIVCKENAEEALEEFAESDYDLVITDVSLPKMSGIDLARSILQRKPQTAIIIASGYFIDLTLQQWGRQVRAIVKPFTGADIEDLIADLCRR